MHAEHFDNEDAASREDFKQFVKSLAQFKQRSLETSSATHIPLLQTCTDGPEIVLLGDSMIERMTTTGDSPSFQPWPSETLLSQESIVSLSAALTDQSITRLSNVFNAGVGGDKLENILYRLVGDDFSEDRPSLPGLLDMLQPRNVKLWVLHAGTNNLHPKRGLSDADVGKLRLIMQAALRISNPGTKLLLTGLFYRRDIKKDLVDEANRKLQLLVCWMKGTVGDSVSFSRPPQGFVEDFHLVDHVHLNKEGYQMWMETLYPDIVRVMRISTQNWKGYTEEA